MLGCCRSISDVAPTRSKSSMSRSRDSKSLHGKENTSLNVGGDSGRRSDVGGDGGRRSGKSVATEPVLPFKQVISEKEWIEGLIVDFDSHSLDENSQRKTGGKCPPPMEFDEEEYMEQCRDAAEPALDYYNNQIAPYDDGVTYEMVDLGMSTAFGIPMQSGYFLHSNFIAKPHYSSSVGGDSAPHMLFFAEVWKAIYPDPTFAVLKCQRLGPDGYVFTGHNGCQACGPESDDPIHHGVDGHFNVGFAPCLLSSTSAV